MLALRVLEALGQTEVNDVDVVLGRLSGSDQEVIGLNVTVDYAFLMYLLNALYLERVRNLDNLPFGAQCGTQF